MIFTFSGEGDSEEADPEATARSTIGQFIKYLIFQKNTLKVYFPPSPFSINHSVGRVLSFL
jgi:hypothetical protein